MPSKWNIGLARALNPVSGRRMLVTKFIDTIEPAQQRRRLSLPLTSPSLPFDSITLGTSRWRVYLASVLRGEIDRSEDYRPMNLAPVRLLRDPRPPPFGDRWTRESGQSVDRLAGTRARFSACQRLSSAPPPIKNTFFVPASPGQGPLVTHTDPSTAIYCRGRLHFLPSRNDPTSPVDGIFTSLWIIYIYIYIRRGIRCFLSFQ